MPGLPSWFLWDSLEAFSHYAKTAELPYVYDEPPPGDHLDPVFQRSILHLTHIAKLKTYPWASCGVDVRGGASDNGWHFTVRDPEPTPESDVDMATIGSAVGIDPADVPLALFCGLIHERMTTSTDTTTGAFRDALPTLLKELEDAMHFDASGMANDAQKAAAAREGASLSAKDQSYFDVTVESRIFLPVTTGHGWELALSTVKDAYAAGTSLGDALEEVARAGVRPDLFHHLSDLHKANEAAALDCVNAPEFAAAAAQGGYDAVEQRHEWLRAAGATIPTTFAIVPNRSGLALLSPTIPKLTRVAAIGARAKLAQAGAMPPMGVRSMSLTPAGKAVAGVGLLGLAYLAWKAYA